MVIRSIPVVSWLGSAIFFSEICVYIFLIIALWKRWRETRVKAVKILFITYLLSTIFLLSEAVEFLTNFNNPVYFYLYQANIVVSLFPFFGGITAGFFLIFLDYFENERISQIHAGVYGAFIGAFILNVIHQILIPDLLVQVDESNLIISSDLFNLLGLFISFLVTTNFPASYFVLYVIITTLRKLRNIGKITRDATQKYQIRLIQFTIGFYYIFTLILIVISYQFENIIQAEFLVFLRHIAPHLGVIIGGILIFQAYIRAPVGFLQFHQLEKIMVINQAGLLLFSYDFKNEDESKTRERDLLLSGGVLAIMNLFTEMIKTKHIRTIQFLDNKQVALSYRNELVIVLVADKITNFLWSCLESFGNMFCLKYSVDYTELSVVPKNIFDGAQNLVNLAFGRM